MTLVNKKRKRKDHRMNVLMSGEDWHAYGELCRLEGIKPSEDIRRHIAKRIKPCKCNNVAISQPVTA